MTPVNGAIPSFGRLIGPVAKRSTPSSVLNRQGIWNVKMPWPKWLIAGAVVFKSGRMRTASNACPGELGGGGVPDHEVNAHRGNPDSAGPPRTRAAGQATEVKEPS